MNIKTDLENVCKGEVLEGTEISEKYSYDASLFEVKPQLVVCPKDAEDIKHIIQYVSQHKNESSELSLTARAAGTCMSGGSLNTSIIVDVTKYLNHIGPVSHDSIIVEPGAYYRDMEKVTLAESLVMPSYTASKDLCTVGGMVANNAGGEKSLTYGSTERYVRSLKVILADGNEYEIKPLSHTELEEKKALTTFEGEIYRKISQLIDENKTKILDAKPRVSKNAAGYFLWNIEDGDMFDLTKIFTGSQGTLGIITEITFGLVPIHTHKRLLAMTLKNLDSLPAIVESVLAHKPESFESYDDHTYELAAKYMPDFASRVMTAEGVILTLIAEFVGHTEEEAIQKAQAAYDALSAFLVSALVVGTEEEAQNYWKIRRSSFALLRQHVEGSHRVAPFIDDIIVRPEKLAQFLPRLKTVLSEYKLTYTIAGHIGNGNFHLIPLVDMTSELERKSIIELAQKVFDLVFEFDGSMAGEHNDGIIRTPFLKQMYGEEIYTLFKEVKNIFDPLNIFNPGKKVDGTLEYAMEHFTKDNTCEHF